MRGVSAAHPPELNSAAGTRRVGKQRAPTMRAARMLNAKKSLNVSSGFLFKYGGEGGIDSLRSPCGRHDRKRSCRPGGKPPVEPRRGFSSAPHGATCKKKPAYKCELFFKYGGEGGIRTPDTLPYTHFPGVLLQPLGHLTILSSR